MMNTRLTAKGFTLIEMMIAVAVVGILAAIAFPSYLHYVERGHLTQAYNELLKINTLIKTKQIERPSEYKTEAQVRTLLATFHIEAEVADKYEIKVSVPDSGSMAYRLVAKPKANSGYTKAAWVNSAGEGYRCNSGSAAERYETGGDCAKIGGIKK